MGSLGPAIPDTAECCMTLVVTASLSSIQQLLSETAMSGDAEFDKLELRNRTVTETMSLVKDLGQDNKEEEKAEEEGGEKFDKLELRNRTVTETMSLVSDLGKNEKEEDDEEPVTKKQKFDTLSLRNRDVTETLSPFETEST